MARRTVPRHVEFFYITENSTGYLVSGVVRTGCAGARNSILWRGVRMFKWARRFTSIESAKTFIEQFDIRGTSIIDAAGRVHFTYLERNEGEVVCNA